MCSGREGSYPPPRRQRRNRLGLRVIWRMRCVNACGSIIPATSSACSGCACIVGMRTGRPRAHGLRLRACRCGSRTKGLATPVSPRDASDLVDATAFLAPAQGSTGDISSRADAATGLPWPSDKLAVKACDSGISSMLSRKPPVSVIRDICRPPPGRDGFNRHIARSKMIALFEADAKARRNVVFAHFERKSAVASVICRTSSS